MKKSNRVLACLLPLILLLSSLLPAENLRAQAPDQQSANGTVYLPVLGAPPGPPDFVIISPAPGLTVSGTTLFAVQPLDPQNVARVTFQAGTLALGVDSSAVGGFQTFLDASKLPEGATQLTATATGPTGKVVTKSISVTLVSKPPASANIGVTGATLATVSGNTIVVPDGAANATTISVQDKTQAQVTAEKGINWDVLGVTFLGAIDVQASTTLSKPIGVSSVGFGNRIQPGQAVVTYRILPDADGDGAGELVVVNGANLAPNGTIVSSAVPQLTINRLQTQTNSNALSAAALTADLSGPPGATLRLEGSGFNPASLQGNVAIFRSQVDGSEMRVPAYVRLDRESTGGQVILITLPNLPVGAATLTLRNESSAATAGPFTVTISVPPALGSAAAQIIDNALATNATALTQLATLANQTGAADVAARIPTAIAQLNALRTTFQQIAASPTPTQTQGLRTLAGMIEQSSAILHTPSELAMAIQASALHGPCDNLSQLGLILGSLGALSGLLVGLGSSSAAVAALGLAAASGGTLIVAGALIGAAAIGVGLAAGIFCWGNNPPPACAPSQAASGGGVTGMGSAPPPGGNGCGNAFGGGNNLVTKASVPRAEAGRYTVRIFPQNGGRALSPFTGSTDQGGYFFIPLIPQGEPFKAVALDQLTGATATFTGTGPATGQSTLMSFNFLGAQSNRYTIKVGDTITNGVPGPGAGNLEETGGADIYTFSGAVGQQIFFDLFGVESALTSVHWKLTAPDGTVLFATILNCCGGSDPGVYTLPQSGIYTLKVGDDGDPGIGKYGFTMWNVPPPNRFTIAVGDTITNGLPGPGAGHLESPGVKDIYTFNGRAGQQIFFDLFGVEGVLSGINWLVNMPDGTVLFDAILNCCGGNDPGVYTLAQSGTYTITVGDDRDSNIGHYAFTLWNVPPDQQFSLAIGDTVSPGVPSSGAGNIESPGLKDRYTFNGAANQQIFFDLFGVDSALSGVNWKLIAPGEVVLFDAILNCCGGNDPGVITLPQTGLYTILVGDDRDQSTGLYSFKLWNVPTPSQFNIAIGDTVANGVPGAGAGNLESPGVKDRYLFGGAAGQQVYFDLINVAANLAGVNWTLTAPDGAVVFDRILNCCGGDDPGVVTLPQAGTYIITVGDDRDQGTGTYGFQIRLP